MRALIVDATLVLAVVCELICVIGVAAGATVVDRIHYSGATTSVAPFLVLVAIALRQPHAYTSPVWNGLVTAIILFALNNVLSHAIARVARKRASGDLGL